MSCCASASTSAGTGCYIRYYVHQGCTQALSALPVRHSQHNFHPIPPKHRAFWACAKAALGSPVRPALMLPLCMAQVGSFDGKNQVPSLLDLICLASSDLHACAS